MTALERLQTVVAIITAIATTFIAYNQMCIQRDAHERKKRGLPA